MRKKKKKSLWAIEDTSQSLPEVGRTPSGRPLRWDKHGTCVCGCVWRRQSPSGQSGCLTSAPRPREWRRFLLRRVSEPALDTKEPARSCESRRLRASQASLLRLSSPWFAVCSGSTRAFPPPWETKYRRAHRRQHPGQTPAWRPSCPPAPLCCRWRLRCS